jgi:hypothetical protein
MAVPDFERVRRQRFAENEAVFRRANEQLADRIRELAPALQALPFICECGDPHCTQIVTLSREQYEQVRSNPAHFLVVPGHEAGDERVVREDARVHVIEKASEAMQAIDAYERSSG